MIGITIIGLPVLILLLVAVSYIIKSNSITEACLILITFCMLINTGYLIYSHIKAEEMINHYNPY